jgi:hypothetical protein
MGRAHVAAAAAFQRLTTGFVVLLLLMLATGALILWYLRRWGQKLRQIEEQLAQSNSELSKTGLKELDRLVGAFNQQTRSFEKYSARRRNCRRNWLEQSVWPRSAVCRRA